MSNARFRQGGARVYYQPATDEIHLPPRLAFSNASGYYNVALHELTHWAGHPSRCNRDLTGRFGDAAYVAEELIAKMGAAYLCAHCGIDGELRHASYLQSWLRVLRSDTTAATKYSCASSLTLSTASSPATSSSAARWPRPAFIRGKS